MKTDPKDLGGRVERGGDGVTGHSVGSNPGPGFMSEHCMKLFAVAGLAFVIAVIVIAKFI